jgi:hypothetical protein
MLFKDVYKFHPIRSLPPVCKKKKKIKISHLDGGQLKNVCLLSVCLSVCHEFVPNYLLNRWSDWAKFFLQKLEKMCI